LGYALKIKQYMVVQSNMQAILPVAIRGKGLADLAPYLCTKMVLKVGATLLLLCGAGGSE
jgi:hypothetical protein